MGKNLATVDILVETQRLTPGTHRVRVLGNQSKKISFGILGDSELKVSRKTSPVTESEPEIEYQIEIFLDQPYAEVELYGVYFLEGVQRAKVQTNVFHNAPHTKSRINVKGALRGQAPRFYWTGDVFIAPNATDSDTYEENRNLILNPGPQVTSIPNLEILTGDIRGAGHASATGRFDDEQLFYLTSRGIDPESAKRMVLSGFLNRQIALIDDAVIAQQFQGLISE